MLGIGKQWLLWCRYTALLVVITSVIATNVRAAQAEEGYGGNFKYLVNQLQDPEHTSFYVTKLTFSSDIPLSSYEFRHLVGIKPNTFVTKQQVDRAYRFLRMKKRFSAIAVDMFDDGNGKRFHFTLEAHWILKKLVLEGIWFGKPRYAALYLQQLGDVFDARLHEDSLKAIQKHLHEKGFFKCLVTDELVYTKKYKTITAKIKIKKKSRFRIDAVTVEIDNSKKQHATHDCGQARKLLDEVIAKSRFALINTYYASVVVRKYAQKIKETLQDEGFINARIGITRELHPDKPTLTLIYKVHLGQRKILSFEGNTVFSDDYIKNELIGHQMPDWLFAPDIIAQQLLHEYYKKGYWHTHIKPQSLEAGGYHFVIDEGNPIVISHVEIIDAQTKLPERATTLLSELLKNKLCDQTLLDQSLDKLKVFYVTNGFWDFTIVDKRFAKKKSTGTYAVTIAISKGLQRLWAGFSIEGFKSLETSDFFKKYQQDSSSQHVPFNFSWLSQQRLFLMNYFQCLGYWYVDLQPELIILPDQKDTGRPGTLNLFVQWKLNQGPQIKFGKTIMRGATTVPFSRIEKQIQFKEGQLWNRDKIERTRKRLKRLDIFQAVNVQPQQLSRRKEKKPVLVTLVDDDPVELRARLGYFITSKNFLFKRQSTIAAGASFIVKNPTNRADRMAIEGDWNRYERKCTLDYQQPSPFGLTALGRVKGFASKYIHPVRIGQSDSAFEAYQTGFLMGLSDEYKAYYYWGLNVGNDWLKISRVRGNLKFDPGLINKTLPYFFVEPRFEIDTRNNKVNATKGSQTVALCKLMLPENIGEGTAKVLLEQSLFYEFYDKMVIAGRVRLGHIFRHTFERVLPVERFFLGGPNSVRGYEPDALPPLGVSERIVNGKVIKDYTIQGGSSMANVNLEVRFPLIRSLGAVVFQDIGVLSQSGFMGLTGRWYPGTGFGLRYKTPIGAIRFDFGLKWKRRLEGDTRDYGWSLTLGEMF